MDEVHGVPVPKRFLPLVYRVLAEAYAGEATTEAGMGHSLDLDSSKESATQWTEEEVARAYHESSPALQTALDYLADHPEMEVRSLELARAVYPEENDNEAEGKLYGVLGWMGRRFSNDYGKSKWFFAAERERHPDGSLGYMVYSIPADIAAWLRKASGRE